MFDVANSLQSALEKARQRLDGDARQTAIAQTGIGGAHGDSATASLAQRAIFSEALLGAIHARLAEIKAVTHG
jgi:hypothetical protein